MRVKTLEVRVDLPQLYSFTVKGASEQVYRAAFMFSDSIFCCQATSPIITASRHLLASG